MATFKSSGSVSISELQTFFGTSAGALSSYYRGGGVVPNVSQNSGIPTSGQISLSNFYGASNVATPTPQVRLAVSVNFLPYRAGTYYGYWTDVGMIGGGGRGAIDYVAVGSLPYLDGNGYYVDINSVLWNTNGNFSVQLSVPTPSYATDNDAKMYRVYFEGIELYRSSASRGSGAGGIIYTWNVGTSNPWSGAAGMPDNSQLSYPSNLTVEMYY